MSDLSVLDSEILDCFPILMADNLIDESFSKLNKSNIEKLKSLKLVHKLEVLIFKKIEQIFNETIQRQFFEIFDSNSSNNIDNFRNGIEYLYESFVKSIEILNRFKTIFNLFDLLIVYDSANRTQAITVTIKSMLFSRFSVSHLMAIRVFYEENLQFYYSYVKHGVCYCQDPVQCRCAAIFNDFQVFNQKIKKMGLLEFVIKPTILEYVRDYICKYIKDKCLNKFDVSLLNHLKNWVKNDLLDWLKMVLFLSDSVNVTIDSDDDIEFDSDATYSGERSLKKYSKNLIKFVYVHFTKIRISEIFNIIIEYPDSLPTVNDLSVSLPHSNQEKHLIDTLKKDIENRLLHQGVSTHDILTAYIATIRTLKIIDPTGVLLDNIIRRVHAYLRTREDTIRCIVGSLTEEGPNDLADELLKGEFMSFDEYNADDDVKDWETWTPEPFNADEKTAKYRKCMDIVSMLVNVYGSKELFANEYRSLLADRLLSDTSCDISKEFKYLELLKLRFGESPLHFCEVMLKDITESKRIDNNIKEDEAYRGEAKTFPITALIVSAQFWPQFKEDSFELPENIQKEFDLYTKAYESLRGKRTLAWKPFLGNVDIEVEIKNETFNFNVTPTHAIVLMQFQEKEQWSLADLSKELKMPRTALKKKISFWQFRGLIREIDNDIFVADEEQASRSKFISSNLMICDDDNDEDLESHMKSTLEKREQELQMFWSYVVGMLTNLDSLPIDRIHQMLKMFASTGSVITDFNMQELRQFLDRKVQERLLEYHNENYSLAKN